MFLVKILVQKQELIRVYYPGVARVTKGPRGIGHRYDKINISFWLQNSVEIHKLKKEEFIITLTAYVFQNIIGMYLIECLGLNGRGNLPIS